MRVVSTVHAPSSVLKSCKVDLANGSQLLFIACPDRLEAHALTETGIELVATLGIHARVLDLVPLSNGRVLVTTDPPDPIALVVELRGVSLVVVSQTDLKSRGARVAEFFTGAFAGEGYVFSMHYKGRLNVLKLNDESNVEAARSFDCPIRELNVLSACVAPVEGDEPVLAILHVDSQNRRHVVSRALVPEDNDLGDVSDHIRITINDDDTHLLIPIQSYILVLGGRHVHLVQTHSEIARSAPARKKKRQSKGKEPEADNSDEPLLSREWTFGRPTAWTMVDEHRILIGDEFGRLVLAVIDDGHLRMNLTRLGQTSPPTSLTYLDNGVVYVGSHCGDSQLIQLATAANTEGSHLSVVSTFTNIAPIVDAVLINVNDQAQIVTCSGASTTGSLRVVQKSSSLELLGSTDAFPYTENIFPLRATSDAEFDSWLLVSSPSSSHLVGINGEELGVETSAFIVSEPTLAAGNFVPSKGLAEPTSYVIQITRSAILLVSMDSGMEVDRKDERDGLVDIVLASSSRSQALIALKDGSLAYVSLDNDRLKIMKSSVPRFVGLNAQYSAISIEPAVSGARLANLAALALWGNNTVQLKKPSELLLSNPPLATRCLPASVCSLLLTDFGLGKDFVHLLAGCINGTVVVCRVLQGGTTLDTPRVTGLGNFPVRLVRHGNRVLACGSIATILYWEQGRVQQSAIAVKDVTRAVPVHTLAFQHATLFMTPSTLSIARVNQSQRLHIKMVPCGSDNPKRIAHSSRAKAFGVGFMKTEPFSIGSRPVSTSSFKILDQESYEPLSVMQMDDNEEILSIACLPVSPDPAHTECFVVGSSYTLDHEVEPSKGRILVFGSSEEAGAGGSWLTAFIDVPGAVYSLTSVDGAIVAGVNTSVMVYELQPSTLSEVERSPALAIRIKHHWNHNYIVTMVTSRGSLIYVGDAISSISILRWNGSSLEVVGRHFAPLYPVALDVFNNGTVIAANLDHNLFTLRQASPGDRLLEINGSYHLGDLVNKIIPGKLSTTLDGATVVPEEIFVTSTGRIGVIAEATEDVSMKLFALQRNLQQVLDHNAPKHEIWRAPHSENGVSDAQRAAQGFLDGDLLERFFSIPPDSNEYDQVMEGSNEFERISTVTSEKELTSLLEQLQSLH